MKVLRNTLIITIISWILVSCGGDDAFSGGECPPVDADTSITDFGVVGSTTPISGTPVVNDSNPFSIDWDVESSCTYSYVVTISEDNVLDDVGDIDFFSGTCAFGQSCTSVADFDCDFSTDMSGDKFINCSSEIIVNDVLDQTSPVDQTVYLFLKVTNEMMDKSDTMSEEVIFRY